MVDTKSQSGTNTNSMRCSDEDTHGALNLKEQQLAAKVIKWSKVNLFRKFISQVQSCQKYFKIPMCSTIGCSCPSQCMTSAQVLLTLLTVCRDGSWSKFVNFSGPPRNERTNLWRGCGLIRLQSDILCAFWFWRKPKQSSFYSVYRCLQCPLQSLLHLQDDKNFQEWT